MELSKSYQLVAEISYQVTTNTKGFTRLYLKYGNRDENALTDTIYYEIRQYAYNPYGNYLAWGNSNPVSWHIKDVDTDNVYASGTYTQPEIYSNVGEVVRTSGNFSVKHEEDGTWSDTINFLGYVYTYQLNVNANISLPKIDRLAQITAYPASLTDEDTTITFSYSNPANFKVKVYAMVTQESAHGFAYDEYLTGSPFTWEWLSSNEDKEKLYDIVRNSPNATVSLRLQTYNNNDEFLGITAVSIPLTIVNADPFVELETEETNPKVKAVVGEELIAVNYASVISATATFIPAKNATLKKIKIASVESNQSPLTVNIQVGVDVSSTIFGVVASVEDSRTLTDGDEVIYQLVDYRPITINAYSFTRENPTSDQIYLNAEMTYWPISVNGIENEVAIYYSTDGEEYFEIPASEYSINEEYKTISIYNYAVPAKLHYQEQGTYYLKVEDRYTEANENEPVTTGIPVFEKGEHDIQVNGDLFIADEDRQNKINVLEKINGLVVDNLDDNSTDKAPSQRVVNEVVKKLTIYSTEEKAIGTWTNGKPVYRRCYTFVPDANKNSNIAHNISNLESVTKFVGTQTAGGVMRNVPYYNAAGQYFLIEVSSSTFDVYNTTGFAPEVHIIMEYTKTTD